LIILGSGLYARQRGSRCPCPGHRHWTLWYSHAEPPRRHASPPEIALAVLDCLATQATLAPMSSHTSRPLRVLFRSFGRAPLNCIVQRAICWKVRLHDDQGLPQATHDVGATGVDWRLSSVLRASPLLARRSVHPDRTRYLAIPRSAGSGRRCDRSAVPEPIATQMPILPPEPVQDRASLRVDQGQAGRLSPLRR
jgi:hypothetical protein